MKESGKRPAWKAELKRKVLQELGTSRLPSAVHRAHRVSYDDISTIVICFMNEDLPRSDFEEITDAFYSDTSSTSYTKMQAHRQDLIGRIPDRKGLSTTRKSANALLSDLNSAPDNVSGGDAGTNMSNQEHFDPRLTPSPGRQHTVMSPYSTGVAEKLYPRRLLTSPKFNDDGTLSSSQLGSRSGAHPFRRNDWDAQKKSMVPKKAFTSVVGASISAAATAGVAAARTTTATIPPKGTQLSVPRAYFYFANYGIGGLAHGYIEDAQVTVTGNTWGHYFEAVVMSGKTPLQGQSFTTDRPFQSPIQQTVWFEWMQT